MLDRIANGRTDLVFDYLAAGHAATSPERNEPGSGELLKYNLAQT